MKRKILISNDLPIRRRLCKFGAADCMLKARTENRFGVPMCNPCYNKWKASQEPEKDLNDEFYCGKD